MREEELLAVPEGGDGGEAALAFPAPLPQQEGQRRHRRVSRRRLRGRRRGCAGGFHSSFPRWLLRLGWVRWVLDFPLVSSQHWAPSRSPPRLPSPSISSRSTTERSTAHDLVFCLTHSTLGANNLLGFESTRDTFGPPTHATRQRLRTRKEKSAADQETIVN